MKSFLQTLMETHNQTASAICNPAYLKRPEKLLLLFKKYNITSIFDSGCKDLHWIRHLNFLENNIKYTGGDISQFMVDIAKNLFPNYEIIQHDATIDPLPDVDLLLSNDVMIHLNNEDRLKFLNNFVNSNIDYLLMSCSGGHVDNIDIVYRQDLQEYPFSHVNWYLPPWNFPPAIDYINDLNSDQRLKLWNKKQVKQVVDNI